MDISSALRQQNRLELSQNFHVLDQKISDVFETFMIKAL